MKRDRRRMGMRAAVAAVLWALLALPVLAADSPPPEEKAPAEAPKVEAAQPAPENAEGGKAEKEQEKGKEPDKEKKIPLNLKGASIDNIIDFIRTNTGKTVVKAKDVQANITIATAEPVTPQAAVKLILDALRMEGIAVVETDDTIQLLQAKKLSEMGVETRTITVRFADPAQIQSVLSPVLGDGVKMVADPRSHQLLVTGPSEKLAELEKVVAQLDVLEVMGTQVQIFQLQYADADQVAAVVQAVLQEGMDRKSPGGSPRPGSSGGAQAGGAELTVVPYPAANWVVVRAPKEVLEAAAELIKQLDREKPPELDLNVIPIKHGDATQMAARLSELFRRRPRSNSPRDLIEVTADIRSNALIVMSTSENFEMVRKIVAELDTAESRKTETRTYELTYADAEDVAQQLNDLYTGTNNQYNPYYYYYPTAPAARTSRCSSSRSGAPTAC